MPENENNDTQASTAPSAPTEAVKDSLASAGKAVADQIGQVLTNQAQEAVLGEITKRTGLDLNGISGKADGVIEQAANLAQGQAAKLNEKANEIVNSLQEAPDSIETIVEKTMGLVNDGNYPEAAMYAGTQIARAIAQTPLADKAKEYANKALEELQAFAENPKTYSVKNLSAIGEKCRSSDNKLIKAIGTFCSGLSEFIENPGKKLENLGKMMKESLGTICAAALGKAQQAGLAK